MVEHDHRSLEAVRDQYYHDGLTDGQPILPPTRERVDEMLQGTDKPPDRELVEVGENALTVEKLATNAVMAGCSAAHMPILIAGARAMAAAPLMQADTDPGSWAFQWIVNGPIRDAVHLRSDTGAFGPSFRPNRVIGRALGFAYRNTTFPDGETEGIGTPFAYSMVAGENEERSPWAPYHVDAGFEPDESTITFALRRSFVQSIPNRMNAHGTLQSMVHFTPPQMVGGQAEPGERRVMHTIGPYNAEELANAGMSKYDARTYLAENATRPYEMIAPEFGAAAPNDDPEPLQMRQITDPEHVHIFVIGGSGRFNAVGESLGPPITRSIDVPDNWQTLVKTYPVERDWGESYEDA